MLTAILALSACTASPSKETVTKLEPDKSYSATLIQTAKEQPLDLFNCVTNDGTEYTLRSGTIRITVADGSAKELRLTGAIQIVESADIVYCAAYGVGGVIDIYKINPKTAKAKLCGYIDEFQATLYPGDGTYPLYIQTDDTLWGYMPEENSMVKMFVFSEIGIDSQQIFNIIQANGAMEVQCYDGVTFVISETKLQNKKIELIIATFGEGENTQLIQDIAAFNAISPDTVIKAEVYNRSTLSKLYTKIGAGDIPDMIDLSVLLIPQTKWGKYFVDLKPYIDADSEIQPENFYTEFWEFLDNGGKIFFVQAGENIQTLGIPYADGTEANTWTWDEFYERSADFLYPMSTFREKFMRHFYYILQDEFIEWGSGECRFDSQLFYQFLELAAKLPSEKDENNYIKNSESLHKSGNYLAEIVTSSQLLRATDADENGMRKLTAVLKGFPTPDGGVAKFARDGFPRIAIFNTSQHIDLAWQFARRYLTTDYAMSIGNPMFLFNRPDVNEYKLADFASRHSYGIYPTDEQLQKVKDLFYYPLAQGLEPTNEYDTDPVFDIIMEEAAAYWSGDKTAETVAKNIQNRASIYVNEQR
jgi:hypothetical protein